MKQKKAKAGARNIEDDKRKLVKLAVLLFEYRDYIQAREKQPLAANVIALVRGWVRDNINAVPDDEY